MSALLVSPAVIAAARLAASLPSTSASGGGIAPADESGIRVAMATSAASERNFLMARRLGRRNGNCKRQFSPRRSGIDRLASALRLGGGGEERTKRRTAESVVGKK